MLTLSAQPQALEAAFPFIVGYVSLWMGWGEVVATALARLTRSTLQLRTATSRNELGRPLGLSSCSLISCGAVAPVVALAAASTWMPWVPQHTNEMLSLMTGPLLAVFVVRQLRRDP